MPRSVEITVPSDRSAAVIGEIRQIDEVLGLGLRPQGSLQPPGDIITVQCSNRGFLQLIDLLDRHGIGRTSGTSLVSSMPESVVSPTAAPFVTRDSSDSSWEEVEMMLTKESHLTANSAAIMFIAGFTAAAGIASGALHVVVAAMVIAPGFEPFVRFALGLVTQSSAWRRGLGSAAGGYLSMVLGAAVAAWLLKRTGTELLVGGNAYEDTAALAQYWTSFTVASVSVSVLAGIAGTLLVISHRSVLTAGVMIALALVPTASLVGMGLVELDLGTVARAALRFAAEVGIVTATALLVFLGKRIRGRRPRMLL